MKQLDCCVLYFCFLTTAMLMLSDGEWSASKDLMKGQTAGSVSCPQLTSRQTETFLSTAERFRASSITGQYLQNHRDYIRNTPEAHRGHARTRIPLTRDDGRTWKRDKTPWPPHGWSPELLWWPTGSRPDLVCESPDRRPAERPEEEQKYTKNSEILL